MPARLPPLDALHAFEIAARRNSFAGAAKELNITQSAVSHRIKMLEQHLGYELFTRLPRGLVLNEIGKAYLPSIQILFKELAISTDSVFGTRGMKNINIRAPMTHSVLWLSPLLDRFMEQHPNVNVRVISELWPHDPQQYASDFEIRLGTGNWDGYDSELIQQEVMVPFCSRKTLKKNGRIASLHELAQQPRVITIGYDDLWPRVFSGLDNIPSSDANIMWVDTSLAAIEIVKSGLRFGLIYKRLLETDALCDDVVQSFDVELELGESLYLCTPWNRSGVTYEAELLKTILLTELAK